MKLKASVFSILLFAGLAFGQEAEREPPDSEASTQQEGTIVGVLKHEDPDEPATRANTVGFQLLCGNHVEVLGNTVKNQQIQIATLRRRVSELLSQRENLLLSEAVQPQSESYSSSIREALTASGADPDRCRIEDLISGKITCWESPAAATEPR